MFGVLPLPFLLTGFFQWFILLSVHPTAAGAPFDQCDQLGKRNKRPLVQSKASLTVKTRSRLGNGHRASRSKV
jgi:hypothetical protein